MISYIPKGHKSARPRKDILAAMAQDGFVISDRTFRRRVKEPVREKQELICTTSHGGYYIPVTKEDMEINRREDNSRMRYIIAAREAREAMAKERGIL